MKKKLRTSAGESLTETLGALLVIAIAASVLCAMMLTAGRLNASAKSWDDQFYSQLSQAESSQGVQAGSLSLSFGGTNTDVIDIRLTGGEGDLISYRGVTTP